MDVLAVRIPLPVQFKTRQGDVTKDARIKNGYVEIQGETGRVRKRPGVVFDRDLGDGTAYFLGCAALTPSGGSLSWMVGDIIAVGNASWDISAAEWDAGTTYYFGDWAFYGNQYWYYGSVGSTTGVPPSIGSGWSTSVDPYDTYNNDANYAIGDSTRLGGVTYYAMAPVTGSVPTPTNPYWDLSPPGSARYYGSFAEVGTTATAATIGAAAASGWDAFIATQQRSCPGVMPNYLWYEGGLILSGNAVYGAQYGTAGFRLCGDPANFAGNVQVGTIYTV